MNKFDAVDLARHAVCEISCHDRHGRYLGGGTGFLADDHFITNFHVANVDDQYDVEVRNSEGIDQRLTGSRFKRLILNYSDENNWDFCLAKIPENFQKSPQMKLAANFETRAASHSLFFGYPLSTRRLTTHGAMVSCCYKQKSVSVIQLDASVNQGNSGGPLFCLERNAVVGIVTRKETGLSRRIRELKLQLQAMILRDRPLVGRIISANVDQAGERTAVNQAMLDILEEFERSANVGIGYAFSISEVVSQIELMAE